MSEIMLHRVARAIMEAGSGCEVTDRHVVEWNPRIAQVLKEARAAIDVTTDEIVSRLEKLIEERRKLNPKRVDGNEYIASCASFIRRSIDAALSQSPISLTFVNCTCHDEASKRLCMKKRECVVSEAYSSSLPIPAATPTDSANPPPVESAGPNSEAQS